MRVLNEFNESIPIRLLAIDAPELKQPFGKASKKALSSLVFGCEVTIYQTGIDHYNRVLAVVAVDDLIVNEAMIENGNAWHFKKYSKWKPLAELEAEARDNHRGLWSSDSLPPWEYRKKK